MPARTPAIYGALLANFETPATNTVNVLGYLQSLAVLPVPRAWARARQGGRFVGVDERAYPADYAVLARYNPALRGLEGRWPVPPPLSWAQVESCLDRSGAARRPGISIWDAAEV